MPHRSGRVFLVAALLVVAVAMVGGAPARADGCDDMKQLCKEATAKAAKCAKDRTGTLNCPALDKVRNATCTHADIVCKPAVGEPE